MAYLDTSSLLNDVSKNANEIFVRLFDHHAFVSGEINFFVNEFEIKRQEDDVEGLFKILDKVVDIRETQVGKAITLAKDQLKNIEDNLAAALKNCDEILNEKNLEDAEAAAKRRVSLQKETEGFDTEFAQHQLQVTNAFNVKEQQIRDYYAELEQKLHIDK